MRLLSQYSLLRLKSYFSALTGYSVPKATICTSMADVSATPSSGSPRAFRGHAVCIRVNTATHWARVLRTNGRKKLRGHLYGCEQSSIEPHCEHAKKYEDKWSENECQALVLLPEMNMFCVMWRHYSGHGFTQGHKWAVEWTAVIDKTERLEGCCQWCGIARLMHKVPSSSI